jgi:hypothetical protein
MSVLAGRLLLAAALLGTVGSTLRHYPHQLAYFNELAGGSYNGWRHLLGSAFNWGQDLLLARKWFRAQSIAEPVTVLARCAIDPRDVGFDICDPAKQWDAETGIRPGWYVIGESTRLGENVFVPAPSGANVPILPELVASLRGREPVARCGGAYLVYHVQKETLVRETVSIPLASGDVP